MYHIRRRLHLINFRIQLHAVSYPLIINGSRACDTDKKQEAQLESNPEKTDASASVLG